jgi:3-methyladenine DNA glycosylase/8-oxoguanine DNA glycosylase
VSVFALTVMYHLRVKLQILFPPDFDFLECVNSHGWKSLAPFHWDEETHTLHRVEYLGESEPFRVTLRCIDSTVEAEANADIPQADLTRRVARMLQTDIPVAGFHSYCSRAKHLSHIPALKQGRLLRSPTLFEDVVKVIATTNTTWGQTKSMVARIVDSFGSPLPADETVHAFPTPEQIASIPFEEFAEKTKLGYRNASVHKIATSIVDGTLDLEALQNPTISSSDLYKQLLSLPGIGPYAASCLLIYLGHYDRVNVDSWARTLVGKELGKPVTDKEAHAFFEEYGEWKALVYHFYKWRETEI